MWFAANGIWGDTPTARNINFEGALFPMIAGTGECKLVPSGEPVQIQGKTFEFIVRSYQGPSLCAANESACLPFRFEVEINGLSTTRPAAVGIAWGQPWPAPSGAGFAEAAGSEAPATLFRSSGEAAQQSPGAAWVWHSDGRFECGGQPWCRGRQPARYEAESLDGFDNGDLIAVEFLPAVPALIYSRNGMPRFVFHMIESYANKDDEAVATDLAWLRALSPDVGHIFPVPGLLAGATPAVLLPPGASASLSECHLDGRRLESVLSWCTSAIDPTIAGSRLPSFASPAFLPAWCLPSVERPAYGVRVHTSSLETSALMEVEVTLELTLRRPQLVEAVQGAWQEREGCMAAEDDSNDAHDSLALKSVDDRSVQDLVAVLKRSALSCLKGAVPVLAPRFGAAVLTAKESAELKRWMDCVQQLMPLREQRAELWQRALEASATNTLDDRELPVVLLQRSGAMEGQASFVPVWEQLACQVAEMAASELQNAAHLFSVQFVGESAVADDSIRRCPRCGRLLQKTDGCDSMACCVHGADGCQGASCDHGGGCGHRFNWNHALQVGPFEEALSSFSADFMASDVLCACPNRRARVGSNQDTLLPHPRPVAAVADQAQFKKAMMGAGRLLGISIRAGLPLQLHLNPIVWRWLLSGGPHLLGLDDLVEADLQSASAAHRLRALASQEELEDLGELEFVTENAAGEVVQLAGKDGRVVDTLEDALHFTKLLEQLLLHEGLKALEFIAAGLEAIIPLGQARLLLTAAELEEAVCGPMDIDLRILRQHTEFAKEEADGGYDLSEAQAAEKAGNSHATASQATAGAELVLGTLFEALESFSVSERRGFIQFVSGCSRLPDRDDWKMQVRMDKAEVDGGSALPTARTCGLLLTLPRCTQIDGADELAKRLRESINVHDSRK